MQSAAQLAAVIRVAIPREEIQNAMGPGIAELLAAIAAQGIAPAGPIFSHHLRMDSAIFDFEIGVPVKAPVTAAGRVKAGRLPAAKVARTVYRGPYEGLGPAWAEFDAWTPRRGIRPARTSGSVTWRGQSRAPTRLRGARSSTGPCSARAECPATRCDMKALAAVLVVAALGIPAVATGGPRPSADLEHYLRQIRAWGMTESAHDALFMVAGIVNGNTLLSFSRDRATASWGRRYASAACPLPGADSTAVVRAQRELRERNEAVVRWLRESADRDRSGFVTTEEGSAFRGLVELGYFADYLLKREHLGPEEVAKANGLTLQKLLDRAAAYNEVATRFNRASTTPMPILEITQGDSPR